MAGTTKPTRGRDSDSGKFVTKQYVQTHPKTTETEQVKPRRRSN